MQLYVGPCHVVSTEITVTMVVPIENPADYEVRDVIRFLQAIEILGYLAEKASVELLCCTTMHVRILPGRYKPLLREQFYWNIFEHRPYSSDLAPSNFLLFPKIKEHLVGKCFAK